MSALKEKFYLNNFFQTLRTTIMRIFFLFALFLFSCTATTKNSSQNQIIDTKDKYLAQTKNNVWSKWECTCKWDQTGNTREPEFVIFFFEDGVQATYFLDDKIGFKRDEKNMGWVPRSGKAIQMKTIGKWSMTADSIISWKYDKAATKYSGKIRGNSISGQMTSGNNTGTFTGQRIIEVLADISSAK